MSTTSNSYSKRLGLKINPFRFLLILSLATLLSSCAGSFGYPENDLSDWVASNIVWLGSGDTSQPDGHLIAAYYRKTSLDSQIRLDFLEMPDFYRPSIIIALDTSPGGSKTLPDGFTTQLEWEILFMIEPGQPPKTFSSLGIQTHNIIPRLVLNTRLDTLVISWNVNILKTSLANLQFQVFVNDSESHQVISLTPALKANSSIRVSAPLILAFWNSLPAGSYLLVFH